jgi:signal peptidase I
LSQTPTGHPLPSSAVELAELATEQPEAREAFAPSAPVAHGEDQHGAHLIFPSLLETIRSLLSIVVIALFILTFVAQPFRIPSESMERTLLVGDFLLVNKSVLGPPGHWAWLLPYHQVCRGDVVVFHFPLDPSEHVVKRVAGLPGDRVRLVNGIAYVNGRKQNEPYAVIGHGYPDNFRDQFPSALYTDPGVDTRWWMEMRRDVTDGQLLVPADSYFVLGDNRNDSRDSRYWGFVPRSNIVGRPFIIYFSLHESSAIDATTLPDDKLGNEKNPLDAIVDFARWSRTFRVVR